MQLPVYLKQLRGGQFSALIPCTPALSVTAETIELALSELKSTLNDALAACRISSRKLTVWHPQDELPACHSTFQDGCWTSVEFEQPEFCGSVLCCVAKEEPDTEKRRAGADRRKWNGRRLPECMEAAVTEMTFPATYYHASCMSRALRLVSQDRMSDAQLDEVEIGIMEGMTNIVRHAYRDIPNGMIHVTYQSGPEGVTVIFRDRGSRLPDALFDAGADKVFEFDAADIAKLPEGGMGVALIRSIFDRVEYTHADGINELTVFKRV